LFRTFLNSEQPDDNVVFVRERGQIRPAAADEKPSPAKEQA
jgi:nitrite reductase (NADH) large subunit